MSAYIKEYLPFYVEKQIEKDQDFKNPDKMEEMYSKVPTYMNTAFLKVHEDLLKQKYDVQLSGSTCVAVLFDRNTIFCANAGDSRAVLYSVNRNQGSQGKSTCGITPLSEDHKPCLPVERKRVISVGGRVDTIKGNMGQSLGPMRVWLMD